jgi:hypothetical protein
MIIILQTKGDKMGEECRKLGIRHEYTLVEGLEERGDLEELVIDGMIELKYILSKQNISM